MPLRGSIEMYWAGPGPSYQREQFSRTISFLDSVPWFTRIASYFGSGGTGLSAKQWGSGAFAVYRWDHSSGQRMHFFVQGAITGAGFFSDGLGSPVSPPSTGLAISAALDTSGGIPWKGTRRNDGTDRKGSPAVWGTAGGSLLVWPRANAAGGATSPSRETVELIAEADAMAGRAHWFAGDDHLCWAIDNNLDGRYEQAFYLGRYEPIAGVTVAHAWVFLRFAPADGVPLDVPAGGIAVPNISQGVASVRLGMEGFVGRADFQPSTLLGPGAYQVMSPTLIVNDPAHGLQGLIGRIPPSRMGFVTDVQTHDVNTTYSKAVIGGGASPQVKMVLPWDTRTVPGTGTSAGGIQFSAG